MKTKTPSSRTNKRAYRPCAEHAAKAIAYYDSNRTCYRVRDAKDGFMQLNKTGVKRFARAQGISATIGKSELMSPLDTWLLDVQMAQNVTFAGPLSGHMIGVYDMPGGRVLVTDSPRLIKPSVGSWNTLKSFFLGLLLTDEVDQSVYLFGWLKVALRTLHSGSRRPGQAVAVAGPANCGKSLLQRLITQLRGGYGR